MKKNANIHVSDGSDALNKEHQSSFTGLDGFTVITGKIFFMRIFASFSA